MNRLRDRDPRGGPFTFSRYTRYSLRRPRRKDRSRISFRMFWQRCCSHFASCRSRGFVSHRTWQEMRSGKCETVTWKFSEVVVSPDLVFIGHAVRNPLHLTSQPPAFVSHLCGDEQSPVRCRIPFLPRTRPQIDQYIEQLLQDAAQLQKQWFQHDTIRASSQNPLPLLRAQHEGRLPKHLPLRASRLLQALPVLQGSRA